jgi:hypothetical protein
VLWNSNGTLRTPGQTTRWPPDSGTRNEYTTTVTPAWDARTTNERDPDPYNGGTARTVAQYYPGSTLANYSYQINYNAILFWIKNSGPNPFPPRLRAGGILYYASIPDTITSPSGNMPVGTQAQRDQRFWKEYIDYVMGFKQATGGGWSVITQYTGYGDDELASFNTPSGSNPFPLTTSTGDTIINPKPYSRTITTRYYKTNAPVQTISTDLTDTRYMDYRDNPRRPVTKYWFGPLTMVDFLGNFNTGQYWWPGTCHEAPLWQLKTGVQSALGDVKNNHPNDYLSVVGFSVPRWSGNTTTGYYNAVRAPLGQDYKRMINSLWFPQYVIDNDKEITPYDYEATVSNVAAPGAMDSVPRSVFGTNSTYSMMLAYNQFSDNASSRTFAGTGTKDFGMAGGLGRLGAKKLIIFETDGVASATATDPANNGVVGPILNLGPTSTNGTNSSYFKVRWTTSGTPEYPDYVYGPSTTAVAQTKQIADLITNRTDGYDPINKNTGIGPGFATTRKPVTIHCIAFGTLFNTASAGTAQTQALDLLQYMQYRGGTQSSSSTALDPTKIINQSVWDDGLNNPATSRKAAMQKAFSNCLQDTVGVVLIR